VRNNVICSENRPFAVSVLNRSYTPSTGHDEGFDPILSNNSLIICNHTDLHLRVDITVVGGSCKGGKTLQTPMISSVDFPQGREKKSSSKFPDGTDTPIS
jgi:hypothetical protein